MRVIEGTLRGMSKIEWKYIHSFKITNKSFLKQLLSVTLESRSSVCILKDGYPFSWIYIHYTIYLNSESRTKFKILRPKNSKDVSEHDSYSLGRVWKQRIEPFSLTV